jgi:phenylacetate-CoA ligase
MVGPGRGASAGIEALIDVVQTPRDAALAGADDPSAVESSVLDLFQSVARDVPAYQAFLREHAIEPRTIATLEDFQRLPLITKRNYLYRHPLADLCRNGTLATSDMLAVSSGSTGQPSVWPRSVADEFPVARRFEQAFYDSFRADERRTLAIVCFALPVDRRRAGARSRARWRQGRWHR